MRARLAQIRRHGFAAPVRAHVFIGILGGIVAILGQLVIVDLSAGRPLTFAPATLMMAEIAAGWTASATSFAIFFIVAFLLWKTDAALLLLPAFASIVCGMLMRCGARNAVPTALLLAFTLLGYVLARGTVAAVTPAVFASSIVSTSLNVTLVTIFLLVLPRRVRWLLPQRRTRLEDLLFVVAIGSFSAAVVLLHEPRRDDTAMVAALAIAIHLALWLVARRYEGIVRGLAKKLHSGRALALARSRGARYAGLPLEAARLFFMSIRENEQLRRLSTRQSLRAESARRRVDRLQESVAAAERSVREKELARAKAVSLTSAIDARWRAFMETVPDVLIIADQKGVIEFANTATRNLLGYPPEQLLGKPVSALIPPSRLPRHPLNLNAAAAASQASDPREVQAMLLDASGNERELSVRIQEFAVLGRQQVGIRARDLSAFRAKHAGTVVGAGSPDQFVATMSHEIRTPLHGLMATLDLLRGEPISSEGARRLSIARTSAKALLNITNDILDLSRIQADAISLERKPFALRSVVDEVIDEVRARAQFLKLELSAHVTGRLPPSLLGDPARIKQILRNLLSNALKFTPAGSVTLHAHYDAGKCVIDVKDTGAGVPDDKREAIFEPFVQAESASSRRFGGAGLGLPISRRLCEAMGGSLVLLRTGPSGSAFRVTLPLEPSDEAPIEEQSQRILKVVQGRILVVEDDPASQYVAQTLLESLQCPAVVVGNGSEALELLRREEFDLVLMDCEMPGLDGHETAKRARKALERRIPIVGMTASTMSSDRQRCFDSGMDDVLPKPFSKSALNEMLGKWLSPDSTVAGNGNVAQRVATLPVLDATIFNELWESLQWRMPAMRKIYGSFLSVTAETLELLGTLSQSRDAGEAGRRLHSLLGSAGLVGARQMEYLAAWLGDAVKERRFEDVERTMQQVRDALHRVQQELDRRFNAL